MSFLVKLWKRPACDEAGEFGVEVLGEIGG